MKRQVKILSYCVNEEREREWERKKRECQDWIMAQWWVKKQENQIGKKKDDSMYDNNTIEFNKHLWGKKMKSVFIFLQKSKIFVYD